MVSPAWGSDNWTYIFIGTRLASHGYVVAVLKHWADGEWQWSQSDDLLTVMVHRPRDVCFAVTQLLAKSRTPGELLFRAIEPERIAASGHSIGGYTTETLAGGDDLVYDAL
jgi:predicted dienelactone hydrolase